MVFPFSVVYSEFQSFLACDKKVKKLLVCLEKSREILLNKAISVSEKLIINFSYEKLNDALIILVITGGNCKLKPHLHIEKLEFVSQNNNINT